MKKFKYSLESVLNLQYQLESQEKTAFQEANMKLQEEEDKLRTLMDQKASYEEEQKECMNGNLNLIKVRELKRSIDVMKSRIRTQMINVHVQEKNVEAARIRLTEAMVSRKTYERMKEKAFDEYKKEMLSEESKEIDELVSYTFRN